MDNHHIGPPQLASVCYGCAYLNENAFKRYVSLQVIVLNSYQIKQIKQLKNKIKQIKRVVQVIF